MKKKILAIVLCVAMLAIAIVGGTMAYFTDSDAVQNVMTTGKVNIAQLEQQRDANGNLVDFVQNKPLMPAVFANGVDATNLVKGDYYNPGVKNVVDKIITVKNEATAGAVNQDAFVRTILAFETKTVTDQTNADNNKTGKEVFAEYIHTLGDFTLLHRGPITINGTQYVVAVKVYGTALAPQDVTEPSLKQFYLSSQADNEVVDLFGDTYTILAVSQGTQTAGFEDNAVLALNTAFGDPETVEETVLAGWLSPTAP